MSFDPDTYGTCNLWLDPSAGLTLVDGLVTAYASQRGSLVFADTIGSNITPATDGDKSCLSFNDSIASLVAGSPVWTGDSSRTLAVVYKSSQLIDFASVFGQDGAQADDSNTWFMLVSAAGDYPSYNPYCQTLLGDLYGSVVQDNAWHLFTATYDGTTLAIYLDGNAISSAARTLATNSNSAFLGSGLSDYLGRGMQGWYGDIVNYSDCLTASLADLHAALMAKWGIVSTTANRRRRLICGVA